MPAASADVSALQLIIPPPTRRLLASREEGAEATPTGVITPSRLPCSVQPAPSPATHIAGPSGAALPGPAEGARQLPSGSQPEPPHDAPASPGPPPSAPACPPVPAPPHAWALHHHVRPVFMAHWRAGRCCVCAACVAHTGHCAMLLMLTVLMHLEHHRPSGTSRGSLACAWHCAAAFAQPQMPSDASSLEL